MSNAHTEIAFRCKPTTPDPPTEFQHVLTGLVDVGTPWEGAKQEWESPDINLVEPGIASILTMRVGFPANSTKEWFFAGLEFGFFSAGADQAPGGVFVDYQDISESITYTDPGLSKLGVSASAYGLFDPLGYDVTLPADPPWANFSGYYICNPWAAGTSPGTLGDYRIQPTDDKGYTNVRGRAYHADELDELTFDGTDYLVVPPVTWYFKALPCLTGYNTTLNFAAWWLREDASFFTQLGDDSQAYEDAIEFNSSLLIDWAHDP